MSLDRQEAASESLPPRELLVPAEEFHHRAIMTTAMSEEDIDTALREAQQIERGCTGELVAALLIRDGHLTENEAQQILNGKLSDDFIICARLGKGGMGSVFRGRQVNLNRDIAIKILSPEFTRNREGVKRFHREASTAANLNYPLFTQIHYIVLPKPSQTTETDRWPPSHYFVMELLQGMDLEDAVTRRGPLPVEGLVPWMNDIALALAWAHRERGLVHRDLKPRNIFLTSQGVKILDMGLAKAFRPDQPVRNFDEMSRLTMSGVIMGTPDFIPPDQIRNPHTADTRADIYSLGCTLYYCLTAASPYSGSLLQKVKQHDDDQLRVPPLPETITRDPLGGDLARIYDRMVEKDPARRYQSFEEIVPDFTPLLERLSGTSRIPTGLSSIMSRKILEG